MHDDYEKFINEGDQLVFDDLQIKSASLLKEYLSAKEVEQRNAQIGTQPSDKTNKFTLNRSQIASNLSFSNENLMII